MRIRLIAASMALARGLRPSIRFALAVLTGLLALGATAQTLPDHPVGTVYEGAIPTSRGYRIPLPPGKWTVIDSYPYEEVSNAQAHVVLQESDVSGSLPFAVVRYATRMHGVRWSDLCSETSWTTRFHTNTFGTLPSQNVLKCQHLRLIGLTRTTSKYSGRAFDALIAKNPALEGSGLVPTQIQISEAGSDWVRVEVMARVRNQGISAARFREMAMKGESLPWLDAYKRWGEDYTAVLADAVLSKRYRAVAAFMPSGQSADAGIASAPSGRGSSDAVADRIRDMTAASTSTPPQRAASTQDASLADTIRQMTAGASSHQDDATQRIRDAASTPSAPRPVNPLPTTTATDNRAAEAAARAREEQERARLAAEARQKDEQARIAQAELAKERERQRQLEEARAREQAEKERLAAEVARLRQELGKRDEPATRPVMAHRKALIIGNDSYKHVAQLKAAREDARAMAEGLKRVGYAVTLRLDLSEREMKAAIRNFVATIEGGDEVAFFFAGHGVQLGSANYLIPVDINGEGEAQIRDEAIALQRILDDFSDKKAKFTLAVIDACRDNPFKVAGRAIGSSSRGLAPTTAATGQMVIFSAGTGQRALDNLGDKDTSKNGLFTRVFLKEMQKPAVTIDKIVRDTRTEVVRLAKTVGHDQVPAIYDQVVGEFYFIK